MQEWWMTLLVLVDKKLLKQRHCRYMQARKGAFSSVPFGIELGHEVLTGGGGCL
jgi:hypothetical protein